SSIAWNAPISQSRRAGRPGSYCPIRRGPFHNNNGYLDELADSGRVSLAFFSIFDRRPPMNFMLKQDSDKFASAAINHRIALSVVQSLPDRCAQSVSELAARIGADKLDLLNWARADLEFARLIASKVTT